MRQPQRKPAANLPAKQRERDCAPAEERLRMIVALLFKNLSENRAWISKIAVRELIGEPGEGPALVGNELGKHFVLLQVIVGELLGPRADHETVHLHALSIISQCVFYCLAEQNLHRAFPQMQRPLPNLATLARHVATVSLAALQSETRKQDDDPRR